MGKKVLVVGSGGRVLGVTAYSQGGIADAQSAAYFAVGHIEGCTRMLNNDKEVFVYRTDIAAKALKK